MKAEKPRLENGVTGALPSRVLDSDQALSAHAARLETLLQNLPGMAYRCLNLPHWPMDFVSQGCFDLCGYHRNEIESQKILWGDFTHPEDIDFVDNKVQQAARQWQPFEVEYRIISRDQKIKWIWERGRPVDMRKDGVVVIEGFITDITDRKESESALVHAEAFAKAVVETAVEAVITIDSQGAIESINQATRDMFGYAPGEMENHHCRMLIPEIYYQDFDRFFNDFRHESSRSPTGWEINACDKDGIEFPVHLAISQVQRDPERKFVILLRDLSSQRAAEKEVREQRQLLAHVDRINTLGEMAAGIAHEINQPLTAISMYANSGLSFLDSSPQKTERLRDALQKLSVQAHRAGAVIEHMQQLTSHGENRHQPADCQALVREAHQLAEVEAQLRHFAIVLRLESNLPRVICDSVQVQQVILNLLRNGMESMEAAPNSGSKIVLSAHRVEDRVKVAIVDNGLGISEELARQLYKPFVSTKGSGMGLGLSISRSIIDAHGGQLEFANNATGGATFYFSLPIESRDAQ